ncbi:MAG: hypothetical protein JRE45_12350 [Deltaproteobacteria bacterium]|nr:hypothetical protein [Deltaproteobacteria bacterium]
MTDDNPDKGPLLELRGALDGFVTSPGSDGFSMIAAPAPKSLASLPPASNRCGDS